LAVLFAIKQFRSYVEGDYRSWLSKIKEPRGRLARWSVRIYDFNIIHRADTLNEVPEFF